MSQPSLAESISIVSHERYQLVEDMKATNSIYKNDFVPHHEDLAKWLLNNKKFRLQEDGTWGINRASLHEAVEAVGN